ncbi:hypothetical protein LBMAG49_29210 [Planctomycetota bacterium]|nr:hypothetical protein LBMAG49_29210 [Planctomycetota bacterium]
MQVEELATKGTGRGIISCMHIRPLTVFAICVLATVAKADKFWLGSAEPKGQAQGSSPDCIDGVLLDESASHYHLRVVFGEVWLAKNRVLSIDKNDLSVEAIQKLEQKVTAEQDAATASQVKVQEAIAKRQVAKAVEAAMTARKEAQQPELKYDPVLHVMAPVQMTPISREQQLLQEYLMTGSAEVHKQLRRVRRGRTEN